MTTVGQPPGGGTDEGGRANGAVPPRGQPDEFAAAFGEPLRSVLDVDSWHAGEDLGAMYERITVEVAAAVKQEVRLHDPIRQQVFPRIKQQQLVPGAGVFQATVDQVRQIHEGLLMTGAVEACDATRHAHQTLPLTIAQIGVSLVTYNGNLGTWV
jgi:hypothetical protein